MYVFHSLIDSRYQSQSTGASIIGIDVTWISRRIDHILHLHLLLLLLLFMHFYIPGHSRSSNIQICYDNMFMSVCVCCVFALFGKLLELVLVACKHLRLEVKPVE